MNQEIKTLLTLGIVCVILILGAALFHSKNPGSSPAVSISNATTTDMTLFVRPDSEKIDDPAAKVTIDEFADYECPFCKQINPGLNALLAQYKGKIRFIYRNFPLPQHQYAFAAAEVAEAAGDQGKFWQMHDLLFSRQDEWINSQSPESLFIGYAQELGLNKDQFTQALTSEKYKAKITRDVADGNALGVDATPTFYVDGITDVGGQHLQALIEKELQK